MVAALAALANGLPTSEFRDGTLAWLERHYRPDATVAGSFAGAMAELLGPLGVLAFDSTHPAAKRAAAPHLVRALREAPALDEDLDRWAEAQGTAAHNSGITVGDGAALVMLEASLGRDRLIQHDGGFVPRRSRERFAPAAIRSIAADDPTRLSPNVLLRPILERAILPTVADHLDGMALFGAAAAAPLISSVVATVAAGLWCDRRGPTPALTAGLLVFTLSQLVMGAAPGMTVLLAGRVGTGVAEALLDVALTVMVARVLPRSLRPKMFAAMATAWIVPSLIGPPIALRFPRGGVGLVVAVWVAARRRRDADSADARLQDLPWPPRTPRVSLPQIEPAPRTTPAPPPRGSH